MVWIGAVIACVLALTTGAAAAERRAAFVLDANSGKALYSRSADELRYPASLTKMMTLYLVFERLERGELTLSTRIRLSEAAASVQPSKLDLEAGETITLENAIKALVVKSANDIAEAIAEHIAGSRTGFADMMTERARSLGMRRTVFRNPHGLPDPEQVTTAREMATLGLALADHFPRRWGYFSARTFAFDGSNYRNHNTLLRRMEGVDGIKTGYTRASGFNLVSSIRRDGRHVVGVVLGGATGAKRDAEMQRLLSRAVPVASTVRTRRPILVAGLQRPPRAAVRPTRSRLAEPRPHESKDAPRRVAPARESEPREPRIEIARVRPVLLVEPRPLERRPDRGTEWPPGRVASAGSVAPAPSPDLTTAAAPATVVGIAPSAPVLGRPPSTLEAQARAMRSALRGPGVGRAAAPPPAPVAASSRISGPVVALQVGAFPSRDGADRQLDHARAQAGPLLQGSTAESVSARVNGRFVYRARFLGLSGPEATRTCTELRRRQVDCFVSRLE